MNLINRIKGYIEYLYHAYFKKTYISKRFSKSYGRFGKGSVIYLPLIYDSNRKLVSIGERTTILKNARIQLFPHLMQQEPHITIGNDCYLGYNLSLLAGADITIGNEVLMASNILISSENHGTDPESSIPYMDQPLIGKAVAIADGCWLGERVCVLPGVSIGEKSIIGAGSVVTKNIPAYTIAVGNPAKPIKRYNFNTHIWEKIYEK